MSSTRLDFFLFFFTFKITDCGACRLPCELLFFRRYGQRVGPAAVSIGYRAILKQLEKPCKLPFMLASWLKDQPVYTLLFIESLTPVFGGGGGVYSLV